MKKIITSILVAIHTFSFAQQKELTLKEAINYALEHKADAEKARLEVKKSEYQIQEVRANALPNISGSGSLTYNPKIQATYIDGSSFAFLGAPPGPLKMEMGQKWTSTAEAKLTQILFNQSVFMGLKAARTTREFYILNQQLTENDIIEKVAKSYYQIYQTKQLLENVESNLALTEKTANVVKGLNEAGLAKKIDLDRIIVTLNNLKSARQQAINGLQLSENALKYMIGMEMNQSIVLPKEGFEANYELAFENGNANNRIELQVLEKQKDLLNINTKVQRAALYPSLALQATYGYLGMGPKNPLFYGEKNSVYWGDYSAISLGLNIPIFSGFGTRAKIRQAQIEEKAVEAMLKDTRLALDLAYENARSQLTNNLLTIESQKENVKLAEEVLLNTQNNYAQGLASLTDLLDAERSLSDARNSYTNTLLDYKVAEIELLKSQGNLETLKK
ncbi:MAG: TolC family protein [Capnocytophaga sp.]|nr:TolC family protein [Capnocytophaga sp.]